MASRFYIENLGCAKNQVDAELMITTLRQEGYDYVDSADLADVIIVNSCGFIESAKKESIDTVMAARDQYPGKKIILAGCLAERYGDALLDIMPEADGFFGNRDISRAGDAVRSALEGKREVVHPADFSACDGLERAVLLSRRGSAYLKITEGCDNRCTYCAIPLIRGALRSRPIASIAAEARELIAGGAFEVNLVGQDLGAYGTDFASSDGSTPGPCLLPELLAELSKISGRFWIRLLYIHPDHFPFAILDACAADPRILPYFDLPMQHASATVLRAMNRRGDAETYLALVARIRKRLPDAVIRTTFLVGFPGETEEDYLALRDFQDRAKLDWVGVFTYSREEDTPAFSMKAKRVPMKVARERKAGIESAQQAITSARLERFVGRRLPVIVEEAVEGEELFLCRAYLQAPEVDGLTVVHSGRTLSPGETLNCAVARVNGVDLEAAEDAGA